MKKVIIALALVFMMATAAFAEEAFNANGGVLVPAIMGSTYSTTSNLSTSLILSNITGETVTCSVKVFDHNGNDISDYGYAATGGNSASLVPIATGTHVFDIPANSTRAYVIKESSVQKFIGYAVIKWTASDASKSCALIGALHGMQRVGDSKMTWTRPINNGQPF